MKAIAVGDLIRLREERTITAANSSRSVDVLRVFAVHVDGDETTVDAEDPDGSGAFWSLRMDEILSVAPAVDAWQEQVDYEAYLDYLGDADEPVDDGTEVAA